MQLGNWIIQSTASTGAGNLTLGTVTGWPGFVSQFASGTDGVCDYFYYTIRDATTKIPIEAGVGHMSDATTFVRDRVMSRNISGTYDEVNTPVTLAGGPFEVVCADLARARSIAMPQVRAGAAARFLASADQHSGGGNTKTIAAGTIYVSPFRLETPALVSGAGVFLNTVAASSTVRLGLYRLTLNCEPGGLICETGDIVTSAGGNGYVSGAWISGSARLKGGFYYLAIKAAGGNPILFACENSGRVLAGSALAGLLSTASASPVSFATAASAGAAMPATMPALSWVGVGVDYAPIGYLLPAAP